MALDGHRVRSFPSITALESFIRTDPGIAEVVRVFQDSGGYSLVYAEGDYVYVGRFVMGQDGQDLVISGLQGDTHGEYLLKGRLLGSTGIQNIVTLRPNGLTTNLIGARSFEFGAPNDRTDWQVVEYAANFTGAPLFVDFEARVHSAKTLNGVGIDRSYELRGTIFSTLAGAEVFHYENKGSWLERATEISSLVIHSSSATGILKGSEVLVFRPDKAFTP